MYAIYFNALLLAVFLASAFLRAEEFPLPLEHSLQHLSDYTRSGLPETGETITLLLAQWQPESKLRLCYTLEPQILLGTPVDWQKTDKGVWEGVTRQSGEAVLGVVGHEQDNCSGTIAGTGQFQPVLEWQEGIPQGRLTEETTVIIRLGDRDKEEASEPLPSSWPDPFNPSALLAAAAVASGGYFFNHWKPGHGGSGGFKPSNTLSWGAIGTLMVMQYGYKAGYLSWSNPAIPVLSVDIGDEQVVLHQEDLGWLFQHINSEDFSEQLQTRLESASLLSWDHYEASQKKEQAFSRVRRLFIQLQDSVDDLLGQPLKENIEKACQSYPIGSTPKEDYDLKKLGVHSVGTREGFHLGLGFLKTTRQAIQFGIPNDIDKEKTKKPIGLKLFSVSFYTAIEVGDYQNVLAYLNSGANPNQIFMDSLTPVLLAVKSNHISIVELLLFWNADILSISEENMSTLHYSILNDSSDITCILLRRLRELNISEEENTRFFLQKNKDGISSVELAIKNDSLDIIDLLMQNGLESVIFTDYKHMNPIHMAAKQGNLRIFQYFLDHGYDYTRPYKRQKSEDEFLLASYNTLYENTIYPIHLAAEAGSVEIVELLISLGESPNRSDTIENTPLHMAAKKGHYNLVLYLLKHPQIEINKENYYYSSMTAFHFACLSGNLDIVQLFVNFNADASILTYEGKTPIQLAQENKHSNVVNFLEGHNECEQAVNQVSCAICLSDIVDAVVLSCGHSFCEKCVEKLRNKACPLCQQSIKNVVPNFSIRDLASDK